MPSILVYAVESDLQTIAGFLNVDADIAYVIPDGPRRWRTVDRLSRLAPGPHALWHRLGGSLPLLGRSETEPDKPIVDPDAGWIERLPAATSGQPFFGSHPAVVWLHVGPADSDAAGVVPMSAFGWIGNRYRATGHGAAAATTAWWRRLQRWIRAETRIVPRGRLDAPGPIDVAAFPAALARLEQGATGALNPPVA